MASASVSELPLLDAELNEHKSEMDAMKAKFEGKEDDEMVLFRFCRGYKWDVGAASAALEHTLEWKKARGIDAAYKADAAKRNQREFVNAEKVMAYYPHNVHHKELASGCPLSLERTAHVDPDALVANVAFEEFEAYHIMHMENKFAQVNRLSRELNRVVGSVKIMDLDGLGRQHMGGAAVSYLRAAITISQTHYPETLNKLVIINAPWIFNLVWAIVRPWLNERTLRKLVILGADYRDTIHEHMGDASIVPTWAGGTCECPEGGCVYEPTPRNPEIATVAAGSQHDIVLDLPDSSSSATWSFLVQYYDVDFWATFQPASGGPPVTVQESVNVIAKKLVQGSFNAPEAGKLTLTFGNLNAYWYSKVVEYRAEVLRLAAVEAALEQAAEAAAEFEHQHPQ